MAALGLHQAVVVHALIVVPGKYQRVTHCCVFRIECIFLDHVHVVHRTVAQSLVVVDRSRLLRRNRVHAHATLKNPDLAAVTVILTVVEARHQTETVTEVQAMHRRSPKANLVHG